MAADARYTTIRGNALDRLADLTANPKPEYWIDGQRVLWQQYHDQLERTIAFCDQKIAEGNNSPPSFLDFPYGVKF